jgi:sugar phosphate isomerase/epimerase
MNRRSFLEISLQATAAALAAPGLLRRADAAENPPWQIGCYTRPWAEFDYRTAMDDIATAGFKHAGLMTTKSKTGHVITRDTPLEEADQVGREARQRGLGIASAWGGDIGAEISVEEGIKGLRRLVDVCAAAGVGDVLLGGVEKENLFAPYYKAVSECCAYAAEKKVGLSLKPHGGLNATGPQLRKCLAAITSPYVKIFYDAGNILYYSNGKVNPVEDCATLDGVVAGWCVKDFQAKPKRDVELTPGDGLVDFQGVFARLKKGGFTRGALVVETLRPGDRKSLVAEAARARAFVEHLVA